MNLLNYKKNNKSFQLDKMSMTEKYNKILKNRKTTH